MPRYIDAEQMEKHIMESKVFNQYFKELVQSLIWGENTVDVVPVVRCKECGHYNTTGCSKGFGWCESMDRGVSDNWYCANGAKMEDKL